MEKNKDLIISHTDYDGKGQNVIVKVVGLNAEVLNLDYPEHLTCIKELIKTKEYKKYKNIYIADLNVDEKTAEIIDGLEDSDKFKLLDHHYDYAKWLNMFSWAKVREVNKKGKKTCGTEMFYHELLERFKDSKEMMEKLKDHRLVDFVESVRLYDTWDWTITTEEINKKYLPSETNMYIHFDEEECEIVRPKIRIPRSKSTDERLLQNIIKNLKNGNRHLTKKDLRSVRSHQGFIKEELERKENDYDLGNYQSKNVAILTLENYKYGTMLARHILDKHPTIDFALIYTADDNKVSLRTNKEEVNVFKIAERFGGGGHPKAAGFTPDNNSFLQEFK